MPLWWIAHSTMSEKAVKILGVDHRPKRRLRSTNVCIPTPLDPKKMMILWVDRNHPIGVFKIHLDKFCAWAQMADNLYHIV